MRKVPKRTDKDQNQQIEKKKLYLKNADSLGRLNRIKKKKSYIIFRYINEITASPKEETVIKKKVEYLENKGALKKKDKYDKGEGKFRSSRK